MKRSFLRCLLFGSVLLTYSHLNGQNQFTVPTSFSYGGDGNNITSNVPLNMINIHAFRHFRKRFPSISNESWCKTDGGYLVSFIQNTQRNQAHYNLRGAFLYSVKYYGEKDISNDLGASIKKKYPDYRIDVVTEITNGEKTFYLVKIENKSSVKTISVIDGKLEIFEDLINGK